MGSILVFSTGAYFVQQHLVNWLLRPAHGQHFIYTSPGGAIGFLFSVCFDVGLILSLPVIAYELIGFLAPVTPRGARSLIARAVSASALLAVLGVAFGYFVGLPLAMHFLTHQFTTAPIKPLLTIQEYMSFVAVYLGGSALLFQIPLVLIVWNGIRPLPPKRLIGAERYVIVAAFVIAMIMAPTVNVAYQLIIAVPIIMAYQVGVGIVWWQQRRHRPLRRPNYIEELLEQDRAVAAARREWVGALSGSGAELSTATPLAERFHIDIGNGLPQSSKHKVKQRVI